MLENLAQDVRSNLVFKVAQLPPHVWDAMKEASVKVFFKIQFHFQDSLIILLPDMDDLFLVFVLGQCGQSLSSGARDKSWILEPRYPGCLRYIDNTLTIFFLR